MGTLKITAFVDCSGPLFDGSAEQAVGELTREVARRGAEYAEQQLRAVKMNRSGRAKGNFQAHLQLLERNAGFAVPGPMIRGVTWSPWLEGVSKRNKGTFRGYHMFRDVRRELEDGRAQEIAEKTLQEYLPRLGGEAA